MCAPSLTTTPGSNTQSFTTAPFSTITDSERENVVKSSRCYAKYINDINSESAEEKISKRREEDKAEKERLAEEKGEIVVQETRRFDEKMNETVSMRLKESSVDYKYFPEPNIFPIRLDNNYIEDIRNN